MIRISIREREGTMKSSPKPKISARKAPRQARSSSLVEDLLEAAARVLRRDGAGRFTTVRVADEAGISVGSLYQYFPNKQALLFRLQTDEWAETWALLDEILGDTTTAPPDRLRRAIVAFFRSERDEAALRVALDDAGALFRHAPEAKLHQARAIARFGAFMAEAIPHVADETRAFAADFVLTSVVSLAERLTSQGRSRSEVDTWAKTCAESMCAYLASLAPVDTTTCSRAQLRPAR